MKLPLKTTSRILCIVSGISLVFVLFVPIWRIDLDAPQYPEGLSLKIHANDLKGNVDIINGLNHYIGMKTLHKADFPEFTILPWCIIFFAGLFFLTGILKNRKFLLFSFFLFLAFGVLAMVDFYRWEYDYGHNLNPNAAIVVPGMAYQPPLIGFRQLLNFGAYSLPDTGGWIFIGSGILVLLAVVSEWRIRLVPAGKKGAMTALVMGAISLTRCSSGPEPLKTGSDPCAHCKMIISDPRFGAELITSKGKVFKFDDIVCLSAFIADPATNTGTGYRVYFTDYCGDHALTEAGKSYLLSGSDIACPMQGHLVSFSNPDSLQVVMELFSGEPVSWSQAAAKESL
ncbi:MAG: nitrous oxide reductase accessory protein NosL [Bacteroidia bacterium]|nr:nitrous oxide reductase accessory protein NosL [Bacteroidia bacterium]